MKYLTIGIMLSFIVPTISEAWISAPIIISGGGTSTVKSDGTDVRYGSGTVELPIYIDSWTNYGTSNTWIKINISAGNTPGIYMYYNNPNAVDVSSGTLVFDFFDDFNGASVNTSKWTIDNATGVSVTNGYLRMTNALGIVKSIQTFNPNSILEVKYRNIGSADGNGMIPIGLWVATNNAIGLLGYTSGSSDISYVYNDTFVDITDWGHSASYFLLQEVIKASTVDFYAYETTRGSNIWNYINVSKTVTNLPIRLGQRYDNAGGNSNIWDEQWDWVLVRKYTANTITISYGAEETNPGTIYPQWSLRRSVTITNSGSAITDYQMLVPIRVGAIGGQGIKD